MSVFSKLELHVRRTHRRGQRWYVKKKKKKKKTKPWIVCLSKNEAFEPMMVWTLWSINLNSSEWRDEYNQGARPRSIVLY